MMGNNLESAVVEIPARAAEEVSSQPATVSALGRRLLHWFDRAWIIAFTLPFAALLWHNRYLFSRKLFPTWDFAADAILTGEAKRFDLLVGNHSRLGFFHPGPADSYIRAAGETLFYNVLHIVPSPWNAQVLTMFLLNCVLFATAVWIVDSWTRSRLVLIGVLAVGLGYLAQHPYAFDSPWMPNIYMLPFLLLLVSAASVSCGRTEHLWALVLAGGLLIHGHVSFFIFVPPIAGLALAVPAWRKRRRLKAFVRREWRRGLAAPLVLTSLFALPMLLNLALHWPGEFGKYLAYGAGNGGHTVRQAVKYSLWYWRTNGHDQLYFFVGLTVLAVILTLKHSDPRTRRFLLSLLAADGVATAGMVYYAVNGVDDLASDYIGKFTYMVPLTVLLVVAANALDLIGRNRVERVAVAVAGSLMILFALHARGSGEVLHFNDSQQPAFLAALDRAAGGRTIALDFIDDSDWQPAVGMIDVAVWNGKRMCFIGDRFARLITTTYVCRADDMRNGVTFNVIPLKVYTAEHLTTPILARFGAPFAPQVVTAS